MSGFEVPGSLLELPAGPDDVCRLAEDFLLAWDVGLPEPWDVADARLDEAQARLGVRLPPCCGGSRCASPGTTR